jgi:NhaA family Na+:H+ antiporter
MRPIVDDLTPPVDLARDHWRGGEQAAVTLVEYGDYECPYSRAAFRTIGRLEQQLGGQLRFVFRHLPLIGIHPHALAAAHLAEAAALQGRFWPMHELLFGHQQALTDPDLLRYADQLGWTVDAWASTWRARRCPIGSRPTPTAPSKAAPAGPRPCSSTDGGTGLATTRPP